MDDEQLDRLVVAIISAGVIAGTKTEAGYAHEVMRQVAVALRHARVIGEHDTKPFPWEGRDT